MPASYSVLLPFAAARAAASILAIASCSEVSAARGRPVRRGAGTDFAPLPVAPLPLCARRSASTCSAWMLSAVRISSSS